MANTTRAALAAACLAAPLVACQSGGGTCPGAVTVTQGLLAGGGAGKAIAASAFFSFEVRVVLAGSGCALLSGGSSQGVDASTITLDLATGIGPGTYQYSGGTGSPFQASYSFNSPFYGGEMTAPQSGTLTLTQVDPAQGVQGTYHLDFGGNGISGGSSGPGGGTFGTLGELIEDGTFVAPICAICGIGATAGKVGPPPPFGDAGISACDDYYAAQYTRCGGPMLPAAEGARQLALFEQYCQNQAELPGSGVTVASIEACVAALDPVPCDAFPETPAACNFLGSLPDGSSCVDGVQCQSGSCSGPQTSSVESAGGPATCGTCAAPVLAATPGGGIGAACNIATDDPACQPNLYCAPATSTCQPLEAAAAPCCCTGACATPFVCAASGQPSKTCVLVPDGGSCSLDVDCAQGLGCVQGTCAPVTWVGGGQPCSESARCLVGSCLGTLPDATAGTCPAIIPAGQPCTVYSSFLGGGGPTCDAFSECFGLGTCALIDSVSCE